MKEETGSVQHGVGLGIMTANNLCISLDGELFVKSKKLEGTTVTFTVKVTNFEIQKYPKTGHIERLYHKKKIHSSLSANVQNQNQIKLSEKSVVMDESF